jgi:F-type H+-transporting ATPase subunit b
MAEDATTVEHVGAPEQRPEPTNFGLLGAPQWIALAMLAVFAIMLWKRVPALIGRALDKKIAGIRAELDEAEQLRKDAEALKAEYEARAATADAERQTIIARAHHEAEAIVAQAKADTAALIERRTRMAEDKIAAAERHALDEVRARAASAAAAAAARLIAERHGPDADRAMVDEAIVKLAS